MVHAQDAPATLDYRHVLNLFPIPPLARRIFGTLENGRIDRRLRHAYRGLKRDLDLIREHLRNRRPAIVDLPAALVPFELLFQITLLGGARDDSRQFYAQIVSELETIVDDYLSNPIATVADTLMATSRVYSLFQSISLEDSEQQVEVPDELDQEDASKMGEQMLAERDASRQPQRRDARELFNAWNTEAEGEFDELEGSEAWSEGELAEQDLEAGEVAFNYDEWDRELVDHRVAWCRVVEKKVKRGDRAFVDDTRERYKGVVSSIRHQFQLMKPENLTRVANEIDGEDYDLNAVVDYFIDRRAARAGGGHQSERIYTKRLRRRRDVAVSFLLDQSSSTARTIGRHPLQPYTHPGRRIIEIEKEGLVLMSEALEAVGDVFDQRLYFRGPAQRKVLRAQRFWRALFGRSNAAHRRNQLSEQHAPGRRDSPCDGAPGKAGGAHAPADRSVRRPALTITITAMRVMRAKTRAKLCARPRTRASRRSASPSIANRKPSCATSTARLATRSSTMCFHCLSGCRGFIEG